MATGYETEALAIDRPNRATVSWLVTIYHLSRAFTTECYGQALTVYQEACASSEWSKQLLTR